MRIKSALLSITNVPFTRSEVLPTPNNLRYGKEWERGSKLRNRLVCICQQCTWLYVNNIEYLIVTAEYLDGAWTHDHFCWDTWFVYFVWLGSFMRYQNETNSKTFFKVVTIRVQRFIHIIQVVSEISTARLFFTLQIYYYRC